MKIPLRALVIGGLLGALTAVLGLTPIGFVPVPTPAGAATTLHIPAIVAGILEGPVAGALVGLIFGAFSFMRATIPIFRDPLIAFGPRILIGVVAALVYGATHRPATRPVAALIVGGLVAHTVYGVRGFTLDALQADPAPGWAEALAPVVTPAALWLGAAVAVGIAAGYAAHRLLQGRAAPAALAAVAGTLTNTVGVLSLAVWRGYLGPQPQATGIALGIGILHGIPEALVAVVLTTAVHRALARTRLAARA